MSVTGSKSLSLTAGPTTTYTREDIEGIPSVQRDIRDIVKQDPFASFNPSIRGVNIAGQNNRTNRFAVDGMRYSDNFGLKQGGLPTKGPVPLDAVEQLSVKIAPYDITEGDFQGGSINVVMRSGSNRYTGSVFYTYNSDALTGDKSRGIPVDLDFTSKNWGVFASGPILENKLFFALAYEDLKAGRSGRLRPGGRTQPHPWPDADHHRQRRQHRRVEVRVRHPRPAQHQAGEGRQVHRQARLEYRGWPASFVYPHPPEDLPAVAQLRWFRAASLHQHHLVRDQRTGTRHLACAAAQFGLGWRLQHRTARQLPQDQHHSFLAGHGGLLPVHRCARTPPVSASSTPAPTPRRACTSASSSSARPTSWRRRNTASSWWAATASATMR
ncbi:MAG: hypothetical protein WDO12_07745 [Pseudomonadota bacterium]